MFRKSPTLAKSARMGHPTSKAKSNSKAKMVRAANYKCAAMLAEWNAVSQTAGNGEGKKVLDIFLYGNVMLGHGEGGDHIGCF
jgi:hypothetical protein